ncbi:hypothetical protein Ddc_14625 [Ditylenchus destructor]|nr:hypothetical protein Ddc_14625 [Ditylenchus destructor]
MTNFQLRACVNFSRTPLSATFPKISQTNQGVARRSDNVSTGDPGSFEPLGPAAPSSSRGTLCPLRRSMIDTKDRRYQGVARQSDNVPQRRSRIIRASWTSGAYELSWNSLPPEKIYCC